MAEPSLYLIQQRIQTDLRGIVADGGTSYWYTPAAGGGTVLIVKTWDDGRLWDESVSGPWYAVRRGDRHHEEESTGDATKGGFLAATVDIHVLVAQLFTPALPSDSPDESLVVERMLRDVIRKLIFEDVKLGGLVNNIALVGQGLDDTVFADAPANWACGEVIFRLGYTYPAITP